MPVRTPSSPASGYLAGQGPIGQLLQAAIDEHSSDRDFCLQLTKLPTERRSARSTSARGQYQP